MDDLVKLSRNEDLLPKNQQASSNLFEEAWHSFSNQSTTAIVAEVAVGTAVVALAARGMLSAGCRQSLARASSETLGAAESNTMARGIFGRAEVGAGKALDMGGHLDELFPADAKGLRAALESFGGTAEKRIPTVATTATARQAAEDTAAAAATRAPSESSLRFEPRFKQIEDAVSKIPPPDFSKIEEAMQRLPRTGFPKLD